MGVIRGQVTRAPTVYKIGGREVTAEKFAQQTQTPLTTSGGQSTILGRDVGVELPKGARVQTTTGKDFSDIKNTRTFYGTGTPEPRKEKEGLKQRIETFDTTKVSSKEAGKI